MKAIVKPKFKVMQDKDLYNDKDKREAESVTTPETETAAEDGVVYVVNDDGTQFDTSERTYVAVEGLEEELERREEAEEASDNNDD